VLGALFRIGHEVVGVGIVLLNRCSAAAGAGALAAVSAPTGLAVATAQRLGVALAGFVRGGDAVAYTFPERFTLDAPTPVTDHGHR
jgi:FdhD protein